MYLCIIDFLSITIFYRFCANHFIGIRSGGLRYKKRKSGFPFSATFIFGESFRLFEFTFMDHFILTVTKKM